MHKHTHTHWQMDSVLRSHYMHDASRRVKKWPQTATASPLCHTFALPCVCVHASCECLSHINGQRNGSNKFTGKLLALFVVVPYGWLLSAVHICEMWFLFVFVFDGFSSLFVCTNRKKRGWHVCMKMRLHSRRRPSEIFELFNLCHFIVLSSFCSDSFVWMWVLWRLPCSEMSQLTH